MPRFSKVSLDNLATCHPDLQRVASEAIKYVDFRVIEGHRSVERQQALYAQGRTEPGKIVTQIDGVRKKGKHNFTPALAFDFVPWGANGVEWSDVERFYYVGGVIMGIGLSMGVPLRYGGDWDRDSEVKDEKFPDLGHVELL